jgi:hypothetical protein
MVMVTPGTATLTALDDTMRFRAAVTDQFGNVLNDVQITWSSTGEAVAMVDGGGLAQARGNGEARIRATAGGSTGEAVLQVAQAPASVGVTPAEVEIVVGTERQLTATVRDRNDRPIGQAPVEWSSSAAGVAEVSASGLVTGRGEGQATISARSGDALGQAMMRVIRPALDCAEVRTFGNGQTLSGELPSVQITGNVTVAGPTSVCGNLTVTGTGANLALNGQQVSVAGNFQTQQGGTLRMADAAARVTVEGFAYFGGSSTDGLLTAGEIRVRGHFSSPAQVGFQSTGTRVVLDGATPQTVSLFISGATSSRFHDLEIRNPAGVLFSSQGPGFSSSSPIHVMGNLTLHPTSGTVTNSNIAVTIYGDLIDSGHRWQVGSTIFPGSMNLPAQMTSNVTLSGAVTLTRGFSLMGDLTVSGSSAQLSLNGHEASVTGNFTTASGAVLRLTNAVDRLTVGGSATWNGGPSATHLTAGEVRVAGAEFFVQNGGAFQSTGTRVVLDGTAPQRVSVFGSGANGSRFRDLEITNAGGVTFSNQGPSGFDSSPKHVTGTLDLRARLTVPSGVTVTGIQMLFLRGTSVLTNNGTIQTAACTKEAGHTINGTDPCP